MDPVTRLVQRYFDRVLATMTTDGEVAAAFVQVQNMLQPPATLFHPRILRRVLRSRRQANVSAAAGTAIGRNAPHEPLGRSTAVRPSLR